MAIQTQGFQFQNLARYTPVDPTLVGVDFSRIGSGIADAMKLGSSLQQYQMRKQAMEEEQATRESRIAQANAAAKYLAAQANDRLAADIATKGAAAEAAEFESRVPVAQLAGKTAMGELGLVQPSIDAKRARLLAEKASAETATMFVDQERALRAADLASQLSLVPSKANIAQLTAKRQEEELKYATEGADARERAYKEWKQQFDMATTGLSLSEQESRVLKNLADAKESIARSTSTKPTNYIPALNSVSSQIKQIRTTPITVGGVPYNIQTYIDEFGEPPPAGQKGEPKKGFIFNTPRSEQADNTVRLLRLLEREQLGLLQATSVFSPLRLDGAGGGGGGGGGGGMAVNVPTLGGQAQAGAPYLDNLSARIQQALAERLGGGAAQVAQGAQVSQAPAISPPVLEDLINASVTTPTAGVVRTPIAAPAEAPTVRIDSKGNITIPKEEKPKTTEAKGRDFTQYLEEAAGPAVVLAGTPAVRRSIGNLGSLLARGAQAIPSIAGKAIKLAPRMSGVGAILNSADITLGRILSEPGNRMRATEGIATALGIDQQEAIREERVAGLLDQINNVLRSNLSRDEKLARARELQGRINEIRSTSGGVSGGLRSVPSASGGIPVVSPGGTALLFPGITSIAPATEAVTPETQIAEELTGPLVESDRVSAKTPIKVVDLEVVLRERPAGPWSEAEIRAINKAREEGTLPLIAYDNNFRINFARQNAPQIMDRLPVIGR